MPAMQIAVPALRAADVSTVTAAQMAEVDRSAVEEFGITLLQMMEQAGSHLADVVRMEAGGDLREQRVVVAVGPGNNGGGGLVAARHQLATLIAIEIDCCVATYDLSDDDLEHCLRAPTSWWMPCWAIGSTTRREARPND